MPREIPRAATARDGALLGRRTGPGVRWVVVRSTSTRSGDAVERLDHVQLAMPADGEVEARGFYEGLLGLTEVPKPLHLAQRGGCWFELGDVKIHLGVEQDVRPAKKAHPTLVVSDLESLVDRLRDAGIDVVADEPFDGRERVYAYDPFGNRLELVEALGS